MYFRIYRLRNTSVNHWLKSPVSMDPLTIDILNGPKHSSKLKDGTFSIFIDHYKDK